MPANLPALGAAPAPPPAALEVYRLSPAANFAYIADPTSWDVFKTAEGWEVLPILETFSYYPGQKDVAAVKDPVSGKWVGNPSRGLNRKRGRGKVIVPTDWTVQLFDRDGNLLGERQGYVHALNGHRGKVHLNVWTRPYKMGEAVYKESDTVGFHTFLRRVRDELLGGGPNPEVKNALRAKLAELLRLASGRNPDSPRALVLREKIAALDAPPKKKGKR
jgi:hypothetical protein